MDIMQILTDLEEPSPNGYVSSTAPESAAQQSVGEGSRKTVRASGAVSLL